MNLADFENRGDIWPELARDFRYSTPGGQATWSSRHIPGWATLRYHFGVIYIISKVAQVAKAGHFGTADFALCCRSIAHRAESCGAIIEIEGLEHVSKSVPAVFVGNHSGSFETLVIAAFVLPFGDVTFVLKEALTRYPVLKHLVQGIDPVSVGRTNPREDLKAVVMAGVTKLKSGVSFVIFPQATRSPVFDMRRFSSLGIKLAGRAGVPIVPVAIKTDFLRPGRILKDYGPLDPTKPVRFRFGPPQIVTGRPREAHRATMEFIAGCLEEWKMPVIRTDASGDAD